MPKQKIPSERGNADEDGSKSGECHFQDLVRGSVCRPSRKKTGLGRRERASVETE